MAAEVEQNVTPQGKADWEKRSIDDWVLEGHKLAQSVTHGDLATGYPAPITSAYERQVDPVVELQLEKAGSPICQMKSCSNRRVGLHGTGREQEKSSDCEVRKLSCEPNRTNGDGATRLRMTYTNEERYEREHDSFPNVIALSEASYQEIDQHRIPAEREVIAALANAPGALDFYLWVLWRSWTLNGAPVRVPITGPGGLSDQLGATAYSLPRRFRHTIVEWLARVKHYWPECPAFVSKDRCVLEVRSSRHSPAVNPVQKLTQGAPLGWLISVWPIMTPLKALEALPALIYVRSRVTLRTAVR